MNFLLMGLWLALSNAATLTLLTYDGFPNTTSVGTGDDETYLWEISGISHNNDATTPVYYGISDTILKSFPKRIWKFELGTDSSSGLPLITTSDISGVIMQEPSNYPLNTADTESVVYLEATDGSVYFIVSTEGYRQYGTFTNFFLYNETGGFVGNLSYDTDTFQEQGVYLAPTYGFAEGDGVESMSASSDYSQVIFVGSDTLVQDDCGDLCVRISLNTMSYDGNIPEWTETAQYVYQTQGEEYRVSDATIVESDLSIVIILERLYDNVTETFDTYAYMIDLSNLDDTYNVQSCRSYTAADCSGKYGNYVSKTLIADLNTFDIPDSSSLHFDSIAAGNGEGCADDEYFVMVTTDNDERFDTIFAYFCFSATDTFAPTKAPTPEPTRAPVESLLSLLKYDTFDASTSVGTGDNLSYLWEISGISHNNDATAPAYYGISDTILNDFPKRIWKFELGESSGSPVITASDISGVVMAEPSNYPLFTADTESVVYLEATDGTVYFIVNTEGYREFDTFTNFFLYDESGSFVGNLSYDVDTFQEQGGYLAPTYGFPEGDGVESMSASSDYSQVIFIGSNTLVQDDCDDSCARISVNTMSYDGDIPSWTESAQYAYPTEGSEYRVKDATIVTSDLSIVLVLEVLEDETDGTFDTLVYMIDLSDLDSSYNIQSCRSLTDADCSNYGNYVSKTLIGDLNSLGIPNSNSMDFDAIAAGNGYGCEDDEYFIMAATDNDEIADTVFAYFCFAPPTTTTTDGASYLSAFFTAVTAVVSLSFV